MPLEILINQSKLYQCPRKDRCDQNFSGIGKGTCRHTKPHEFIMYECTSDNCKNASGATCIRI